MTSCLALSGFQAGMGSAFYAVSVGGSAAHLCYQLYSVDYTQRESCLRTFNSNKWLGAIVFAGIVIDKWLQPKDQNEKETFHISNTVLVRDASNK